MAEEAKEHQLVNAPLNGVLITLALKARRGPGSIHGFVAETPTRVAVSDVRITTKTLCACNLATIMEPRY